MRRSKSVSYTMVAIPEEFTPDEIKTATLLVTEGYPVCGGFTTKYKQKVYHYRSPRLDISMCDREALEPASRVFGTRIMKSLHAKVVCPPHLFPPDGKGVWRVSTTGKRAEHLIQRLRPILTKEFLRKWEEVRKKCV